MYTYIMPWRKGSNQRTIYTYEEKEEQASRQSPGRRTGGQYICETAVVRVQKKKKHQQKRLNE